MATTALLVATGVGTALAAAGSIAESRHRAAASRFNATIANQQAERARKVGKAEEQNVRRKNSRFLARQRVLLAAAGVEIDSGTPLAVQMDDAAEAELEALMVRNNAELNAARLDQQAGIYRSDASYEEAAGIIGAGTTLLQGANVAFGRRLTVPAG